MLGAISVILVVLAGWYGYGALRRPGYALALVLSLYTFEQVLQQGNAFLLARSSLINLVFAGVTCAAILMTVSRGGFKRKMPQAAFYCYALFFFAVVSLGWSVNSKVSMNWAQAFAPYAVLFTFLVPLCATNAKDIRDAIKASLILGFFITLGLALSTHGHRGIILDSGGGVEIEANPLASGNYGGYIVIIGIFSIYSGKKGGISFIFKAMVAVLGVYTLFKSGSRGQTIAMIIAVMIWLPVVAKVAVKKSTIIALVLATAVLIGLTYMISNSEEISTRWQSDSLREGTVGRFNGGVSLVQIAATEGPLRMLFGIGNCGSFSVLGWYPHMVPLEILGEEGMIGFFLFSMFVFYAFSDGYKALQTKFANSADRVNIGLMLSLFTFEIILACKQGCLLLSPGAGMFCMGLCLAWSATSTVKSASRRKRQINRYYQQQPLPMHHR